MLLRDDYPRLAREKGEYMMERLQKFVTEYPQIYESITGK